MRDDNTRRAQAVRPAAALDEGARPVAAAVWREHAARDGLRTLPCETAVALVHDGATLAVMMATPLDLEDFAIGFALTEGVISHAGEARRVEVAAHPSGIEARLWLPPGRGAALARRRRALAGPTGCGLCGVDSLEEAARVPSPLPADALRLAPAQVLGAMAALAPAQALNTETHAVHAAGFWTPGEGLVAVREDVGRHNALDKLAGALARGGRDGTGGAVLLTSRVSVEMVQKAAAIRAPVIVAVSAPTTLAVETAQRAGMTLCAVARADGFEVFTHPQRIAFP